MDKNKCLIALFLLLSGILFFGFCRQVPYYSDDWWYAFVQVEEGYPDNYPTQRVASIGDAVQSVCNQYLSFNSRVLPNLLVQTLIPFLDKPVFDLLNVVAYVLFLVLLAFVALPRGKLSHPVCWVVPEALLFFVMPCHYDALMWATGSVNYLWTGCLLLAFCLLWQHLSHTDVRASYAPWLFLYGLLCGWSHEGLSIGLVAGCGASLFLVRKQASKSLIALFAGLFAGVVALTLSPGVWNRLRLQSVPWSDKLSVDAFCAILLPLGLALSLCLYCRKDAEAAKQFALRFLPALVAAAVLLPFAFVADNGEHRAFWGASFFSLVPLTALSASYLSPHCGRHKRLVAIAAYCVLFAAQGAVYAEHAKVEATHRRLIADYRKSCDGLVALDAYRPRWYAVPYTLDVEREYKSGCTARHMAAYYGKPPLRWYSVTLYEALAHPEAFFVPENRVPGTAGLFSHPKLDVYLWEECAGLPDSLSYEYAPVAFSDHVPLLSKARRLISPASYPATETLPAWRVEYSLSGYGARKYIGIEKDRNRNPVRIDRS